MTISPHSPHVPPSSCLILGGGISGLMAATVLQNEGVRVTVLDKGRGIGGRLATRRIRHSLAGEGVFDYGAQSFAVSQPSFQRWVDGWLEQGVVQEWSICDRPPNTPCYRGTQSNRGLAQYLAQGLDIQTQTRITQLRWESPQWMLQTAEGQEFRAEAVLITAPLPQALALLEASAIALPPTPHAALTQVCYQPCIALLALLKQPSLLPSGGVRSPHATLSWLVCNQQKGISPQAVAVTIHATPDWSETHWDLEDAIVAETLLDAASPWLGGPVVDYQVHRWRYSQPQTWYAASHFVLEDPGLLLLAGDAFQATPPAPTVSPLLLHLERAALSGVAAATDLLHRLTQSG